jgi:hypothetical protein
LLVFAGVENKLAGKGRMVCGAVALAAAKRRANDTVRNAVMKL